MNGEQTIRWNHNETLAMARALLIVQNGVIAREGGDPYSIQTIMASPLAVGNCMVSITGLFNCSAIKKVPISVDTRLGGDYIKGGHCFYRSVGSPRQAISGCHVRNSLSPPPAMPIHG